MPRLVINWTRCDLRYQLSGGGGGDGAERTSIGRHLGSSPGGEQDNEEEGGKDGGGNGGSDGADGKTYGVLCT